MFWFIYTIFLIIFNYIAWMFWFYDTILQYVSLKLWKNQYQRVKGIKAYKKTINHRDFLNSHSDTNFTDALKILVFLLNWTSACHHWKNSSRFFEGWPLRLGRKPPGIRLDSDTFQAGKNCNISPIWTFCWNELIQTHAIFTNLFSLKWKVRNKTGLVESTEFFK